MPALRRREGVENQRAEHLRKEGAQQSAVYAVEDSANHRPTTAGHIVGSDKYWFREILGQKSGAASKAAISLLPERRIKRNTNRPEPPWNTRPPGLTIPPSTEPGGMVSEFGTKRCTGIFGGESSRAR